MSVTSRGDALLAWMIDQTEMREELMEQERSRAVHAEFLEAESGMLPSTAERTERMRDASARAWLRLTARAVEATWPSAAHGIGPEFDAWLGGNVERLEVLEMEEHDRNARRGLSGDPASDDRAAQLRARIRLFGEWAGESVPGGEGPAATGRALTAWLDDHSDRLAELQAEAMAGPAPEGVPAERIAERAAMWAHVRLLTEALDAVLP